MIDEILNFICDYFEFMKEITKWKFRLAKQTHFRSEGKISEIEFDEHDIRLTLLYDLVQVSTI